MRTGLHSVTVTLSRPVSTPRVTTIVLANDHAGLRHSLRSLLDREEDVNLVGEASNLEDAVRQVTTHSPRVLVLDLRMPNGFSAERIQRLRVLSPTTEIVVTTMQDDRTFAAEAHAAGAIGFVLADTADRELVRAVRRAARGAGYTSPRVRCAVA